MPYTPQSQLSKTRAAMAVQIVGSTSGSSPALTVGTGRAYLGWNARDKDSLAQYADAALNGPFANIGLPQLALSGQLARTGPATVPIALYIAKDFGTSWDGQDVCDLVANMVSRLMTMSAYTSGATGPTNVNVSGYNYEHTISKGLLVVTLGYEFLDPVYTSQTPLEKATKWLPGM